jgi:hypothetical protein
MKTRNKVLKQAFNLTDLHPKVKLVKRSCERQTQQPHGQRAADIEEPMNDDGWN